MEERKEAFIIKRNEYESGILNIEDKTIRIEKAIIAQNDIQMNKNENEGSKTWESISINLLLNQKNSVLKDYKIRTNLINLIVDKSIENEINGIVIDLKNFDTGSIQRFMIELAPKLREIGINTCIVLENNMNKNDYINIVDYIVE